MAKFLGRERGRPQPIGVSVLEAITSLREKNRRASRRFSSKEDSAQNPLITGREMLALGRIVCRWRDIVGPDVSRVTLPTRLIKGNLQVICKDSQWMQTFHFVKEAVKEKIRELFPETQIKTIFSKVAPLPERVLPEEPIAWPDWEKEVPINLTGEHATTTLLEVIQRCHQKMEARKKGILAEGKFFCVRCGASLVLKQGEICSVCHFKDRKEDLIRSRSLLSESPWLSYAEILEKIPSMSEIEYQLLRSELLVDSRERVNILVESIKVDSEETVFSEIRREMIRYLVLYKGELPYQITLEDPENQKLLDLKWIEAIFPKEEEPC